MRSRVLRSAASRTARCFSSFTSFTPSSVRSRTIDSTSRPTYPTSVNFDASIFRKGDRVSFASRRAISVFPTPVGPKIASTPRSGTAVSSGVLIAGSIVGP